MADNYDAFRAGMLRAAEMCRSEFKRAPEAAKGHDSVYMGGYEDACDHLSAAIAQAAVIDSVRIVGAQPDWQYHISLLLPDGIEDVTLLKIYQVVECEIRRADSLPKSVSASTEDGSNIWCDDCRGYTHSYDCPSHPEIPVASAAVTLATKESIAPMSDIEEREAAVCPEDMGFEEYIAALRDALRPFAAMHREGDDPSEAVLVRGDDWILNSHLARAHRLTK